MGCSYDGPYAGPSEAELRLMDDGFEYSKWEMRSYSTCGKCGAAVPGGPHARRYIDMHIAWHNTVMVG